ncbi:hypothetical protein [Rariglobus hedericola]|uniref:Uncharacterized protein n=1 Tax=Rariglobus hedericola TaxID=2597822 RepID=A0A556QLA1_9BACT|nr:hypothetical protein [Rariglobus hedericola]TSJ77420.1 hypothetical protein FPL22_15125 [Rariglobus hedericola]
MNSHETNSGKILLHGSEAGEITPAMIEHRAQEIALIEGHDGVSSADRRTARQELQGRTLPETTSDDSAVIASSMNRDPSDPVSVPGHQTQIHNNEGDDPDMIERLAIEGVEEAQHEQMLASRRQKNR